MFELYLICGIRESAFTFKQNAFSENNLLYFAFSEVINLKLREFCSYLWQREHWVVTYTIS